MEENPWGSWSSDMEMEDEVVNESLCETNPFDEEFLRDILLQPEEGGEELKNSSIMPSLLCAQDTLFPTTYILSFEKSAAALLPTETDHRDYSSSQLPSSSNSRANHGTTKKPRSASESLDHIMSERNRRQELTSKFIALAATIPGLKKMDKAHVLGEAINYVKQLQERVEELEEDIRKNGVESAITIIRSHLCIDDDTNTDEECYGPNEALPEVEARVLGKEVLIKIYCGTQKGILLKIMSQIERLHLYISTSNVLPFGNTLDITIIAQMGGKYNLVVKDLVKELRQVATMKSCDVQQ